MNAVIRTLVAVLLIPLVGCAASFRDTITKVDGWPPAAAKEKKSVSVTFGVGNFSEKPEKKKRHYVALGKVCWTADPNLGTITCKDMKDVGESFMGMETHGFMSVRAFRESGLFSEVTIDGSPADINVQLKVLMRSVESSWMWVPLVSLFLFPGQIATTEMVVRMTFKDREDKVIEKVRKVETGDVWMGGSIWLTYFFRHSSFDEAEYDMTRSILIEARQKGII